MISTCPRCGEDGERIAAPVYREDVPVFDTWYCRRCGASYPVLSSAPETRRTRTPSEPR